MIRLSLDFDPYLDCCPTFVDDDDEAEMPEYQRTCEKCGGIWYSLHCAHDGHQRPCVHCGHTHSAKEPTYSKEPTP